MIKRWSLICGLCCLLGGSIIGRAQQQAAQTGTVRIEPYRLRTYDGREHEVELGRLRVREDRESRTNTRQIELVFVRLRSTAEKPGPPIVYLAGGPGIPGIGMGQVPVYFSLFERLRAVADVILLDQRGTGMSSPSLQCPPPPASAPADVLASEASAVGQYVKILRSCADEMRARGIDPAAYTANAVADDVEDLRRALGAERLSLIGMSYGTHLALALIRRHAASIDRAVLAGTLGPDHAVHLPGAMDLLIRRVSQLLAQDANLSRLIPDFAGLVKEVLARFEKEPVTVQVTDRRTNQQVSVKVGKVALQMMLDWLSDGRALPALPAFFYLLSRGDYSQLARRVEGLYNSLGGAGNSLASVALGCSSGWSEERMAKAMEEGKRSLVGVATIRRPEYCQAVGNPDLGEEFRARIWSTTPVLFLSGGLDGNTPPYQAEEVRWGFPRSAHIVIDYAGHETLPIDEVQMVVVDFLKGQDVSGRRIPSSPPRFRSPEETQGR